MLPLNPDTLLNTLPGKRIGVIGDVCLDVYWEMATDANEASLETGLPIQTVRTHRYGLGGAGNVACNLRALGVGEVHLYGVTAPDPFGHQIRHLMHGLGLPTQGIVEQAGDWATHTYIKPLRKRIEQHRIDLGTFNRLTQGSSTRLIAGLAADIHQLDALIVNQQVNRGIHHASHFQKALQDIILAYPEKPILVNSRSMSRRYDGTMRKINAYEARQLIDASPQPNEPIRPQAMRRIALQLADEWGKPVFVSCGEHGCWVAGRGQVEIAPAVRIDGTIDSVGAGDSLVAGIAAALSAGNTPLDAARFGNWVAGVTVQQVAQTGTASPEQIRRIAGTTG